MQQFHLLNKTLRSIFTKLTHRACNSPPATGRATDEPTDQPSQNRRAEPLPTPPGPVPQLPSVTKALPPHLYKCGGSPRAGSGITADKACHLNLLLEITRLFTLKGVPLIGKKNVKSRKNHFIHRPESRHRAIKRKRATGEPTDQTSPNRRAIKTISPSPLTNQPRQKSSTKFRQ